MGMKRLAAPAAATLTLIAALAVGTSAARAEESDASRDARWKEVAKAVFDGKPVSDHSTLLSIDAPPRALDAALVPVTITVDPKTRVTGLTLVIDDNPAPVAAKFQFGPLADPHEIKTRVRVDQYTLIHAVAQLADGSLISTARFIKAAGGCSAPGTEDAQEALARIGRMKMRFQPPTADGDIAANLLISHPNFNGMQMNPVTRLYTPARYVQTVTVTEGGESVFSMQGDISLAEDPSITFLFHPAAGDAPLDVNVTDSAKADFHQSFLLGQHAS